MDNIKTLLKNASRLYNRLEPHFGECDAVALAAHEKLQSQSTFRYYGNFNGKPVVRYHVFATDDDLSRPVRADLFIRETETYKQEFKDFHISLTKGARGWTDIETQRATRVVYTAVMSVACCFDLWQRTARKTPGTFFEIFVASLVQCMMPQAELSKHIPLAALIRDKEVLDSMSDEELAPADASEENDGSNVSTDLVVGLPKGKRSVVLPLKITTRERIVQPFAHQRILDAALGEGRFKSMLVCISETQLDRKTTSVKQVCVPGTVKLFQKYLAPIGGLYYCDLPQRYAAPDMQRIIPVKTLGDLFRDIDLALTAYNAN